MPFVSVVVAVGGDADGTVEPSVGADDLSEPPHPATASSARVVIPMEASLRMRAAY
jgi:hypothetical protein